MGDPNIFYFKGRWFLISYAKSVPSPALHQIPYKPLIVTHTRFYLWSWCFSLQQCKQPAVHLQALYINFQKSHKNEGNIWAWKSNFTRFVSAERSGEFLSSKNAWNRLIASLCVSLWPKVAKAIKTSFLNIVFKCLSPDTGSQPSFLNTITSN